MSTIIKGLAILTVLSLQVVGATVSPLGVLGLLLLSALWVYRERYTYRPLLVGVEYALILGMSAINPVALILASVLAFDVAARGAYAFIVLLAPASVYFLTGEYLVAYLALLFFSALGGYQEHRLHIKEASFREVYDQERRIRYSLEDAKAKLMNSAREAAHLAEIRERNRIAREIHDHIGHSLAGILLQLQVVHKVQSQTPEKAQEMLQQSITGLAQAVNLLRDTVHNLKPREQLGLDYIKKVVDNFQFCPVDFQQSGDFSALTAAHTEIITTILKEALTNASRHSRATKVEIHLEVRTHIVRLYIRDNGQGCRQIREGLGLSGMKERVRNAGGTITFNPGDGFMIVCVLPLEGKEGGAIHESLGG